MLFCDCHCVACLKRELVKKIKHNSYMHRVQVHVVVCILYIYEVVHSSNLQFINMAPECLLRQSFFSR